MFRFGFLGGILFWLAQAGFRLATALMTALSPFIMYAVVFCILWVTVYINRLGT